MLPLESEYDMGVRRSNHTLGMPITRNWDVVYRETGMLHAPTHQFWWSHAGRVLAILLHNAQYNQEAQYRQLKFFAGVVIPYLGQIPGANSKSWKSFMTDDGNPIELSWEWRDAGNPPKIRYSVEPIGPQAGTRKDPHNTFASADFLVHLGASLPEADLRLFKHLRTQLQCEDSLDVSDLEGHKSNTFFAFDLDGEKIAAKAYFFPTFRAREMKQCTANLISSAIRSSPGLELIDLRALSVFEDFLTNWQGLPFETEMLSIDLETPSDSRFKIYFRSRQTDFVTVKQVLSLGGRLNTQLLEIGLEDLKHLWDGLFDIDGNPGSSLPEIAHRTAGILYYVEIKPGASMPTTKIYIPVRHYASNDETSMHSLAAWLRTHHRGSYISSFFTAMKSAL